LSSNVPLTLWVSSTVILCLFFAASFINLKVRADHVSRAEINSWWNKFSGWGPNTVSTWLTGSLIHWVKAKWSLDRPVDSGWWMTEVGLKERSSYSGISVGIRNHSWIPHTLSSASCLILSRSTILDSISVCGEVLNWTEWLRSSSWS
jgi:hypothetical protein